MHLVKMSCIFVKCFLFIWVETFIKNLTLHFQILTTTKNIFMNFRLQNNLLFSQIL